MAGSNGQPTVSAERCPECPRNDQADHPDADQKDLPAALPCGVGQGAHDKTWRMPYSHGGFRGEGVKAGWYSPPFPRGSTLAPPNTWLAFGLAGSASPSLSTLGRLAGRPWCPPSLLRQSSAFRTGRPLMRLMYLFGLRPLHLSGTRIEGGHQALSRRYGQREGEPTAEAALLRRLDPTNLRGRESLRCPPSRRVPAKWSGRRPDGYMGRAAAFPVRNAKGCLSSEGGHRRLCAATSGPAAT
jgi:hypothetical protein